MDQFVLEYIKMRMREMDFANYTFAPIRVQGTASVKIYAQNEYYYMVAKTIPVTCNIFSETNIFTEASVYGNFNFYQIQEFSGQIEIVQPGAIDIEFIRVIPRVEPTQKIKELVAYQQKLIAESYNDFKKK